MREQKQQLRRRVNQTLQQTDPQNLKLKSRLIFEHLQSYPQWKRCGLLFSFISMPGEVDTAPMIRQALAEGKLVALPRVSESAMSFHVLPPGLRADALPEVLELHAYGFYQPKQTLQVIRPTSHLFSLMLVPGLAFDRTGARLGRGGGYYDRYIGTYGTHLDTLGICFDEQVVESVPADSGDKKIRALMSDSGILYQKTQQNAVRPSS